MGEIKSTQTGKIAAKQQQVYQRVKERERSDSDRVIFLTIPLFSACSRLFLLTLDSEVEPVTIQ
jgi:hypothetical protein